MSFWRSNFWAAGFWRANFWHGPGVPARLSFRGGGGSVDIFTRRRRTASCWLADLDAVIPPVPRPSDFPLMPWEKKKARRRRRTKRLCLERPAKPVSIPAVGTLTRKLARKKLHGGNTTQASNRLDEFARLVDEYLLLGMELIEAEEMAARAADGYNLTRFL